MKNTFEGFGGRDGSHCGLTDWYDEHEAALAKALAGKRDFDTGWYSSKKEIASARIVRCKGKVVVEVSVSDDFDSDGRGEREVTSPVTLDSIREAIDEAWDDAADDQKANQGYRGYSLHNKKGSWIDTYLVSIDDADVPSGDNYANWGWQSDPREIKPEDGLGMVCGTKRIPKKTVVAFEEFAHLGKGGELTMGNWTMKSWDKEDAEFEDPNDYRGMGWVGSNGLP